MSSDSSYGLEISEFELKSLAELGSRSRMRMAEPAGADMDWDYPPPDLDEAGRSNWKAEQEEKRKKAEAERAKHQEEDKRRRQQAEDMLKAALDERIMRAYQQGTANAVSREALRAISVRSYVLLGVVAAVVAMPLIGMLLDLDPQAFGAYIAPVTGITGTIVGYWFGTVGQVTSGQGTTGQVTTQTSQGRSSKTDTK
jgi:hypothetical protein